MDARHGHDGKSRAALNVRSKHDGARSANGGALPASYRPTNGSCRAARCCDAFFWLLAQAERRASVVFFFMPRFSTGWFLSNAIHFQRPEGQRLGNRSNASSEVEIPTAPMGEARSADEGQGHPATIIQMVQA